MPKQELLEQIYYLTQNNETLSDVFSQFKRQTADELGEISSALRNELSILNASNSLLALQNPTLKEQRQWKIIQENFDLLTQLLYKIERYRCALTGNYEFVNLIELCDKISASYAIRAKEKNISFSYEKNITNPSIFVNYFCDRRRLEDAIVSLLVHAADQISGVTSVRFCLTNPDPKHGELYIERNGKIISDREMDELNKEHISKELFKNHVGVLLAKYNCEYNNWIFDFDSSHNKSYARALFPSW